MSGRDALELARDAFREQAWGQAYARFGVADSDSRLAPADLELYARASFLTGRDDACVSLLDRAYHQLLDSGEHEQAAECAFWLGFNLINRGEMAQAGGWLARAEKLVPATPDDSPIRGLLLVPAACRHSCRATVPAPSSSSPWPAGLAAPRGSRS
ncbi:hypothetical protein [Crystallibacter crystallopoietes]|nr:hypothetical protein [Arthrobacter crystallopoietes]